MKIHINKYMNPYIVNISVSGVVLAEVPLSECISTAVALLVR